MILNLIFGFLALLSLALTLWQWLVARRFPLHQRVCAPPSPSDLRSRRVEEGMAAASQPSTLDPQPPLTLLKPLKGCEPATEDCLRSWFAQQYSGPVQILFGVAAGDDPVCGIVRKLMAEFPAADTQLVAGSPLPGANAKVAKLVELERLAKHDVLIISDADVRVPPDFLANIAAPLCAAPVAPSNRERILRTVGSHLEPLHPSPALTGTLGPSEGERDGVRGKAVEPSSKVTAPGLVCCFYRLANPTTLAMQWEAIAINADFWSQVLQARSLKPLDFALGAVMAIRRQPLQQIGGFTALVNCLADDYQLGNRIAHRGYRIALSPVVVECWSAPMNWTAVWKHQLRWARTIRVCQPVPYFFSLLSNATLWPLLWLVARPAAPVAAGACLCLIVRILTALSLQHRLNQHPTPEGQATPRAPSDPAALHSPPSVPFRHAWMIPLKDVLQAAIWLLAFLGNRVEWRGQHLLLRRDGTLEQLHRPAA